MAIGSEVSCRNNTRRKDLYLQETHVEVHDLVVQPHARPQAEEVLAQDLDVGAAVELQHLQPQEIDPKVRHYVLEIVDTFQRLISSTPGCRHCEGILCP